MYWIYYTWYDGHDEYARTHSNIEKRETLEEAVEFVEGINQKELYHVHFVINGEQVKIGKRIKTFYSEENI